MSLNQMKIYSTQMKGTKEPQVDTHLNWRNWWRMNSHEYGDVPQHLFTSKFMARRTMSAVECNIEVSSAVV